MFRKFYPTKWVNSIYTDVDFQKLYDKGYRGIISDIDNTLVEHDADASEEAINLCNTLRDIGFEICEDGLNDSAYLNAVYKEAVELCAYLCKEYGLTEKDVICHSEGYRSWK